ncbi:hypothetical protein Tco_1481941, partial [Tanacetum coccineum]
ITKYMVKISKKARILELKRRHLKITVLSSGILYAISIKEDMAYQCPHFTKDHEGTRFNTLYPEKNNTPYSRFSNKIF